MKVINKSVIHQTNSTDTDILLNTLSAPINRPNQLLGLPPIIITLTYPLDLFYGATGDL